MKQTASSCSTRRQRLLMGGAVLALAGSLATPAFATPDPTPGIDATGAQVIVTDQSKDWSPVSATATNPLVETTGAVDGSSVAVTGNAVSATARANSASAALTPDARDLEAATGVAQPMLSQQLGVLRKAGLVETRREAKQVFYRINHARIRDVSALLDRFAGTAAGGGAALIPPRRDEGGSAAMFARIG